MPWKREKGNKSEKVAKPAKLTRNKGLKGESIDNEAK